MSEYWFSYYCLNWLCEYYFRNANKSANGSCSGVNRVKSGANVLKSCVKKFLNEHVFCVDIVRRESNALTSEQAVKSTTTKLTIQNDTFDVS